MDYSEVQNIKKYDETKIWNENQCTHKCSCSQKIMNSTTQTNECTVVQNSNQLWIIQQQHKVYINNCKNIHEILTSFYEYRQYQFESFSFKNVQNTMQYGRYQNILGIYYQKQNKKVNAIKLQGNSAKNMVLGLKIFLERGATLQECLKQLDFAGVCFKQLIQTYQYLNNPIYCKL